MKILTVFGTRPEAIKLAPVIQQFKKHPLQFNSVECVTAQHREMLDQILDIFKIVPKYDLDIMTDSQALSDITCRAINGVGRIIEKEKPDLLLVQGDTTTAFAGSLTAYYHQIPVGHVEAGLRTYEKYNPFPEEKNRHMVGVLADFHFAPTLKAKSNLLKENISKDRIWVTGNTVIDALLSVTESQKRPEIKKRVCDYFYRTYGLDLAEHQNKIILVTGHRRESFGEGFKNICLAIKEIAHRHPNITVIYPVHLNPNVQNPVHEILGAIRVKGTAEKSKNTKENIFLIEPLDYELFVFLMTSAYLILTDSGGIQEEAPSLGKPVLVMRNKTERPEGIKAGTCKLVGTDKKRIIESVETLLNKKKHYDDMAQKNNPYGDGKSAEKIVKIIQSLPYG